jgi:UDP-glucose 4-epimerase
MNEDDPQTGARVNGEGSVNTVEQARQDGCDQVVYASTSSIYGSRTEPSPEDMPVTVNTGYEASKLGRERYGEYFANYHDMAVAGLRFFSVYQGYGGAEGHKGEYANVIAQFAEDIASGESPVLYGDGTQTRDFVHVEDVVKANLLAATTEHTGEAFNIATGNATRINTLAETVQDVSGTTAEITHEPPRKGDIDHSVADISKAREKLGYTAEISLDDGLQTLL